LGDDVTGIRISDTTPDPTSEQLSGVSGTWLLPPLGLETLKVRGREAGSAQCGDHSHVTYGGSSLGRKVTVIVEVMGLSSRL
jgi:hypothetical protein